VPGLGWPKSAEKHLRSVKYYLSGARNPKPAGILLSKNSASLDGNLTVGSGLPSARCPFAGGWSQYGHNPTVPVTFELRRDPSLLPCK
jgi:hypothetical protein